MAADKPTRAPRRDDDDDEQLDRLRALAVKVFLALSVVVVLVDALPDPAGSVSPVVMGLVFGTLLALLGLEAANRLMGGGK